VAAQAPPVEPQPQPLSEVEQIKLQMQKQMEQQMQMQRQMMEQMQQMQQAQIQERQAFQQEIQQLKAEKSTPVEATKIEIEDIEIDLDQVSIHQAKPLTPEENRLLAKWWIIREAVKENIGNVAYELNVFPLVLDYERSDANKLTLLASSPRFRDKVIGKFLDKIQAAAGIVEIAIEAAEQEALA
ncbi:MAG: hypothetical protein GY716_04005, partial [bacterium]|nr:hypothetical protein [bacterium]